MAIVGDNNRHNGDLGLDGEMESALLEREQNRVLGVAPRALGKHVDALALFLNLVGGTGHRCASVLAVLAVNEDGCAEAHEPAQEGRLAQGGLGGHAAVLGEDTAEHEHVELGLVVADENGGAGRLEDALRVDGVEGDTRGEEHEVFEAATRRPLCNLTKSH